MVVVWEEPKNDRMTGNTYLKQHGINYLSELTAMNEWDLSKACKHDHYSLEDVADKVEHFTGKKILPHKDKSLEEFTVEDFADLKLDDDL